MKALRLLLAAVLIFSELIASVPCAAFEEPSEPTPTSPTAAEDTISAPAARRLVSQEAGPPGPTQTIPGTNGNPGYTVYNGRIYDSQMRDVGQVMNATLYTVNPQNSTLDNGRPAGQYGRLSDGTMIDMQTGRRLPGYSTEYFSRDGVTGTRLIPPADGVFRGYTIIAPAAGPPVYSVRDNQVYDQQNRPASNLAPVPYILTSGTVINPGGFVRTTAGNSGTVYDLQSGAPIGTWQRGADGRISFQSPNNLFHEILSRANSGPSPVPAPAPVAPATAFLNRVDTRTARQNAQAFAALSPADQRAVSSQSGFAGGVMADATVPVAEAVPVFRGLLNTGQYGLATRRFDQAVDSDPARAGQIATAVINADPATANRWFLSMNSDARDRLFRTVSPTATANIIANMPPSTPTADYSRIVPAVLTRIQNGNATAGIEPNPVLVVNILRAYRDANVANVARANAIATHLGVTL